MAADPDALDELRRRAADDPDLLPLLAQGLAEASALMHQQGAAAEAVRLAAEAVEVVRTLADRNPDFAESLPAVLGTLAARRLDAGDSQGALAAAREAVDRAADPVTLAVARLNLAMALVGIGASEEAGGVLRVLGRSVRALFEGDDRPLAARIYQALKQAAERARADEHWAGHVAYHRALAECLPGDPPAARGLLAQALDRAAEALTDSDPMLAARMAEEATALLTRLAEDDPKYGPPRRHVAGRWIALAAELDDPHVVERAARAAAHGAEGFDRGGALLMLAGALSQLERSDEAIAACREVVALWRAEPSLRPDGEGALLVEALRRLARLLVLQGRHDEALGVAAEGLERCVAGVMHAGVGDPEALAELERLHEDCLRASGRRG